MIIFHCCCFVSVLNTCKLEWSRAILLDTLIIITISFTYNLNVENSFARDELEILAWTNLQSHQILI